MRMLTAIVALSALALSQPVSAQLADPQLPQNLPPAQQPLPDQPAPDQNLSGQDFTNIALVAVEDLPAELKQQAEAVITETSADELLELQRSVDASPQALSVLQANGLNSSQVVAANIDGDGTLTLIIQTTT
ncbi:hypothetical protein RFM23_17755 [Mesorhizobium abyssinicae]|uniref:Uncharacterized protein n=1 Tax=Mesorhizobium abyssinicae TaxID=1209958 RepID=A0ABU5AQB5_9HYPH|nr:hypothetical protein [Mesorhizobium abyssinicae]MDX8539465.1 hypothetical protein [Mesorhizobium abyssinicae]